MRIQVFSRTLARAVEFAAFSDDWIDSLKRRIRSAGMDLSGRTALVTGAGQGIGKGCALELARAGASLVINDRPDSDVLQATADEIRQMGQECTAIEADVFSREGCERLLRQTVDSVDRLDILVSNPAFSRRAPFLEYAPDVFEQTIAGTLTSGFHMSQLAARQMVAQGGGGKILFISSVQAELPTALCAPYSAAKAGLNQLMMSIAVELSPHRINVNAIEPGWIDTPGEHRTFSDEAIAAEGRRLPWGRLGLPADIGKAAVFLCSDAADYITGSILPVDGCFRFRHGCVDQLIPLKDAE